MRRVACLAGTLMAGAFWATSAAAVPCAGFGDVDSTDPFCPSVEWMKNRAITTGCAVGQYCPADFVTRLQMAGFMFRLGNALEPDFAHRSENGISGAVNAEAVVCQTNDYTVTGFPRVAAPSGAMLYHAGAVANDVAARLVYRIQPSSLWSQWSGSVSRAVNASGAYVSQSPTAPPLPLAVGTTIAFAIAPVTGSGVPLAVSVAGCELLVRLDARTGNGTPF